MEFQGGQERARNKAGRTRGPLKALGRSPLALFHLPGPPGLASGSSLASLEFHQGSLRRGLREASETFYIIVHSSDEQSMAAICFFVPHLCWADLTLIPSHMIKIDSHRRSITLQNTWHLLWRLSNRNLVCAMHVYIVIMCIR